MPHACNELELRTAGIYWEAAFKWWGLDPGEAYNCLGNIKYCPYCGEKLPEKPDAEEK